MKRILVLLCSFLFTCHSIPPVKYLDSFGFLVSCDPGRCFSDEAISDVTETTIDVLVEKLPKEFQREQITKKLREYFNAIHIEFRKPTVWSFKKNRYIGIPCRTIPVCRGFIRPYRTGQ